MTMAGTPAWTAPEVLRSETYNESADVFSFALCVLEIFQKEMPWQGINPMEVAVQVAQKGARPPLPKTMPKPVQKLVKQCWSQAPAERPSFHAACGELEQIAADSGLVLSGKRANTLEIAISQFKLEARKPASSRQESAAQLEDEVEVAFGLGSGRN